MEMKAVTAPYMDTYKEMQKKAKQSEIRPTHFFSKSFASHPSFILHCSIALTTYSHEHHNHSTNTDTNAFMFIIYIVTCFVASIPQTPFNFRHPGYTIHRIFQEHNLWKQWRVCISTL
jgi:hypothetical protein